ncbi:class I SAM-dependent methyltransferase [Nostoc punctiforme FACHB-252]|jgi:predicted O-methyltransferase YrrM|uniref:Class I SAM-dependent methyltransferase n=1 Tax=Nostoc punctiforme FACHB-252 TaxID=1357509 RepID=A0ABR8HJ02_NOSPU|nr:class I SAM-dependent methyltransferase [Nostoc punctiforme]MBD2615337.1 class I SAM-dependent methyltransferase [Nostoc punctiforme FACHB-252]
MMSYSAIASIPPLVEQAQVLAAKLEFSESSLPEVGRLLQVLTNHITQGQIAEIGTGCGVGAAWIVSALHPDSTFITIESDRDRATLVQQLFADNSNVRVLQGDWHDLLDYAPFDLLFADGGNAKVVEPQILINALKIGGLIILDDLTPEEYWPPEWQGRIDTVREFWLKDPRIIATEIRVTARHAVILATRIY